MSDPVITMTSLFPNLEEILPKSATALSPFQSSAIFISLLEIKLHVWGRYLHTHEKVSMHIKIT